MNIETVVVLFVITAILGLVGVVVIDSIMTIQEAEAQENKNCPRPSQFSPGFNNTQRNCIP
jgi:hypothetical protein